MKIKGLISNCCEPQTEDQCYKLSGKIKDKYRLLKIIAENYNLAKNGCFSTNRELAAYLASEKFAEDMKVETISRLLSALVRNKKIKIIHFGGKKGKRIILVNKVSQKETVKIFVEKHKKSA